MFLKKHQSQTLCGFKKAPSTKHTLFRFLWSWQQELDELRFVGTILMILSKAYDCIPHELLMAKLEVYGLHKNSLNLEKTKDKNRLCVQ